MVELNERFVVCDYAAGTHKRDFIHDKVEHSQDREDCDDGFVVFDFGDVIAKQKKWNELLPRVRPFYAVKCRPYLPVLKVMVALGVGFDCASKTEMESILRLGVDPSQIVYSHTRKQVSYLKFASTNGIDLMTFDDEDELHKIKRVFPKARLLLRFAIDDPTAAYPLGIKFGCKRENTSKLLQLAKDLQLCVVGIHFHIGSGSHKPVNYRKAIARARELFDVAEDIGFKLSILDIGGGFPGLALSTGQFEKYAEAVNAGLAEHFPKGDNVDVIAEPGTYYMESATTVVANIIGKRKRSFDDTNDISAQNGSSDVPVTTNGTNIHFDYYLNDGLYTSLIDHLFVPPTSPVPLKKTSGCIHHSGTIYGYTCCGTDVIMRNCSLPELCGGDWVFFEDKGDYSYLVTNFNGFKRPFCYYAVPENCRMIRHIVEDEEADTAGKTVCTNVMIPEDLFQLQRDSDE